MKKRKKVIINWIKNKKNFSFMIFLFLGIAIASYRYSFIAAVIGFVIIIIISLIAGFIINKLIK